VLIENNCFNRYDHYLKSGAREGRVAHLLFDPTVYRAFIERSDGSTTGLDRIGAYSHFPATHLARPAERPHLGLFRRRMVYRPLRQCPRGRR